MRTLGLGLILALPLLAGCEWMNRNKEKVRSDGPRDQAMVGAPTSEKLVSYLNRQADRLGVIESEDVDIVAHVQGKRMPGLRGFMVCEKPRSFRLTGDNVGTTWVDIGSNGERFWFWVKDGDSPLYHCSYADYEKGVKLPLPFQPEWVVQALGMAQYDRAKEYKVEAKGATIELSENTTVQGVPVRKVVIFNAREGADPSQPRVTGHVIQDARTGKIICQATVRRMRTATYRTPEGEQTVSYPSDVLLEWPSEQMSMTMKVGKAKVNTRLTADEESRYFTLPNWPNIKAVDLARMVPRGNPTGATRDVRQIGGYK
jgi:hypothetical protein